jgi:nucleotide-binding universal stress UspA family protein
MTHTESPTSIVVGIDGSDAAILAAEWAVDEALNRDLPLRLVHVIEPGSEAVRLETEYAEIALRAARAAVDVLSRDILVESAIRWGGIAAVLADESRNAEMICIGSAAIKGPNEPPGDSTSAALTESAHCPVAIIGTLAAHSTSLRKTAAPSKRPAFRSARACCACASGYS